MRTHVVEELVKKLVDKLVDEKYGQKVLKIESLTKDILPSYVGRIAKVCRGSCHPM
jgi:ribosomal protein S19